MKFNKIKILACSLVVLGGLGLTPTQTYAATLHPTGLNQLHENIPGIKTVKNTNKAVLPKQIDLSSEFPAVTNQGNLGSCVAFATGYADKTYQENVEWDWGVNTNAHIFSPAYIYSQIHASNADDGGGSYFSDAFNLLKSQGCTTLSDMPYNGNYYAWKTKPTAKQKTNAAKYKAQSWSQLADGDYNAIKSQLASGNPVVIGISVYEDFDNLDASNPIFDKISGPNRGGHALCVVGYDDAKRAVKIINSWGTDWGINGYGWISYDLIKSEGIEAYVMTDAV